MKPDFCLCCGKPITWHDQETLHGVIQITTCWNDDCLVANYTFSETMYQQHTIDQYAEWEREKRNKEGAS